MEGRRSDRLVTYVEIAPATDAHPRNDSASIVQLDDGSLFMVWIEMHASELGGHDEAPSSIASMRSTDGGLTWGEHRIEQSPGGDIHSVYNPSLIVLPGGELLFFYLQYNRLVWNEPLQASGCLRRSADGGRTWGAETRIWDHEGYGCANHTLTRLADGRLLKSVEYLPVWGSYPAMSSRSGCFASDDDGRTWRPPASLVQLPLRGTMENHIVETAQGGLADVHAQPARLRVPQPLDRSRRDLEPAADLRTVLLRVDAEPDAHPDDRRRAADLEPLGVRPHLRPLRQAHAADLRGVPGRRIRLGDAERPRR